MLRVLIAVSRQARERLSRILTHRELRFVESAGDLHAALGQDANQFVILGAHFDESNTLGVLQHLLTSARSAGIVCVRGSSGQLGEASIEGLRIACAEVGALGFLDLTAYPDDGAGNAHIRGLLERLFRDIEAHAPQ